MMDKTAHSRKAALETSILQWLGVPKKCPYCLLQLHSVLVVSCSGWLKSFAVTRARSFHSCLSSPSSGVSTGSSLVQYLHQWPASCFHIKPNLYHVTRTFLQSNSSAHYFQAGRISCRVLEHPELTQKCSAFIQSATVTTQIQFTLWKPVLSSKISTDICFWNG